MHRTRYSAPIEPGIVAGGCQALQTGTTKAHAFLSQNNRIADSPLFLTRQPDPRHDGSGYGFSYCWCSADAACHLTVSSGTLVTGCGLILCASLGVTYGLVTRLLRHTPGEAVRQATH